MIVKVHDLWKRFGRFDALKELAFGVAEGSAFALVGPNGAGKTTTIKILMNLLEPSQGDVAVLEVRDSGHRLIRTNHVAFVEGSGDVNQSVSRRHAYISYEPHSRGFRLHDDGSEHGTGIVRNGRTVAVPRGSRGVRLHSADEIVLGEARLRVKFDPDPAGHPV